MKFEYKFYPVLAAWLRKQTNYTRDARKAIGVSKVTGFDETLYEGGGCSTCSYTEVHCIIYYHDLSDEPRRFEYSGDFSELLGELLDVEVE